jgi:hypothetical protein
MAYFDHAEEGRKFYELPTHPQIEQLRQAAGIAVISLYASSEPESPPPFTVIEPRKLTKGEALFHVKDYVLQEPVGVITCGTNKVDNYALLRLSRLESNPYKEVLAIGKLPKTNAEPLHYIAGLSAREVCIGRHDRTARDGSTSRRQFSIFLDPYGSVKITHFGTFPTNVFTAAGSEVATNRNGQFTFSNKNLPIFAISGLRQAAINRTVAPDYNAYTQSFSWVADTMEAVRILGSVPGKIITA